MYLYQVRTAQRLAAPKCRSRRSGVRCSETYLHSYLFESNYHHPRLTLCTRYQLFHWEGQETQFNFQNYLRLYSVLLNIYIDRGLFSIEKNLNGSFGGIKGLDENVTPVWKDLDKDWWKKFRAVRPSRTFAPTPVQPGATVVQERWNPG